MNRTNAGANTNTLNIIMDGLVIAFSYFGTYLAFRERLEGENFLGLTILMFVFTLVFILSNKEEYLYNVTLFYYFDRVHRKLTKSFLLAMAATVFLEDYVSGTLNGRKFYLTFLIVAYVAVCLKMFLNRKILFRLNKQLTPRTAFVGTKGAYNKFRYFLNKTSIQIVDVGYIAVTREVLESAPAGEYIGCMEDLEELVRSFHIDQIYIIQKRTDELSVVQQYADLCISMGVTVRLIVDIYKRRRANSYVSTVGTYPIITYHTISLNTYEQIIKRLFDIFASFCGIVVSSPMMLITAVAIKLDSKGPVLFKQTRVGQNGRHFQIYKFRSMYADAEEMKKHLMEQNEIQGGIMFKMKDDPRVTKVGRVIRKLSIDEFPQFFNVLGGSMSLVGTRPPTVEEVQKYNTSHWRRISIKPGITGMWQVNGRSKVTNFEEIVEMDVDYIDNWSLFLDFKILLKTVLVLIRHNDAY